MAPRRPATRRRSASAARRVPPGGCRANASPEERRELIFVLDRSSGSRLGRILPIQDHDLCSWSRPQRLEVVIVLKPPFGPGRCIAVPIVLCRLAQDSVVRVGAPPAVNWLTSFAASGCAAAATPRRKSGAEPMKPRALLFTAPADGDASPAVAWCACASFWHVGTFCSPFVASQTLG